MKQSFEAFWREERAPYRNGRDLLDDLMRLVAMLCAEALEQDEDETETLEQAFARCIGGAIARQPLPWAAPALAQIRQRVRRAREENIPLPFADVVRQFGLGDFAAFCLLLAVCPDLDVGFEQFFSGLQGERQRCRATLQLAARLYSLVAALDPRSLYAMLDRSALVNELLLSDWQNDPGRSALLRPLAVPQELLYELTGVLEPGLDDIGPAGRYLELSKAVVLWNEGLIEAGTAYLRASDSGGREPQVLYLWGGEGLGKSFALAEMARRAGRVIFQVDAEALCGRSQDHLHTLLCRVAVRCLLDGAIPCLDRLDLKRPEMELLAERAVGFLRRFFPVSILCANRHWCFSRDLDVGHLTLSFEQPEAGDRRHMWECFAAEAGLRLTQEESERLAGCYRLSPAEIRRLTGALARHRGEDALDAQVAHLLRERVQGRLGHLARYLGGSFRWEDLQIPKESGSLLRSACERMRRQYQVNETWGFGRRLPYGRGLSILLYGPPGTGKTMAAQVLSGAVGLDLFRVDLSQIVDKYIGETEKNLGRLFDTAEDSNCILFFDEADALFSKRTEVGDSKDKYANIETAYLLQRIEQFAGVTILATNNARNFDEAFRRRMTYFINIPMPDASTRRRIWEKVFPPELPIEADVRFEELAEQFELSGSSIKSIAVSAAYAAAAAGSGITRRCIFEALSIEYGKTGRLMSESMYPFD